MKLSNNSVFVFTTISAVILVLINSQKNIVNTQAPCRASMFSLKYLKSSYFYLTDSIDSSLTMTDPSDLTNFSLTDYVSSCLKHIFFQIAYKESGIVLTQTFVLKTNTNTDNTIYHQFNTTYEPYSTVDVKCGYELNDAAFGGPVTAYSMPTKTTCFGAPGGSMDYVVTETHYGYLLTWTEPSILNAPSICYYNVYFQYTGDSFFTGYELSSNVRAFNVTDELLPRDSQSQIVAVNYHRCYSQAFPSFEQCSSLHGIGKSVSFNLTSRITPTKKPTNSIDMIIKGDKIFTMAYVLVLIFLSNFFHH
jgi:hypothetical protein